MTHLFLDITDKPIISQNPLLLKSAADLGETARLTCEAGGVPEVTFAWSRVGGAYIRSVDHDGVRPLAGPAEKTDPINYRSELVISSVRSEDYGEYECVARNSEGKHEHAVRYDWRTDSRELLPQG